MKTRPVRVIITFEPNVKDKTWTMKYKHGGQAGIKGEWTYVPPNTTAVILHQAINVLTAAMNKALGL